MLEFVRRLFVLRGSKENHFNSAYREGFRRRWVEGLRDRSILV